MKHLIFLAFKYIRRQKLRSMLTFCCLMLAVFLFTSVGAYVGSVQKTLIRSVSRETGGWEVNVAQLVKDSPKENALEIVRNHVITDDFVASHFTSFHSSLERDVEGSVQYFQISLDGKYTTRTNTLYQYKNAGTPDLLTESERFTPLPDNGISLPPWVADYGYKPGDTITIEVTPMKGKLTEDSEQIQAVREFLEKTEKERSTEDSNYICSVNDEKGMETNDSMEATWEQTSAAVSAPLMYFMLELYSLDEIEFSEETAGRSYCFTAVITDLNAGDSQIYLPLSKTSQSSHSLNIHTSAFSPISLDSISEDNPDFPVEDAIDLVGIRVTDKILFEDALTMLLTDLGFPESKYMDYLGPNNLIYNEDLLALEVKGGQAFAQLFPLIGVMMVLALLLWFIARFIIDNAFEISVQERSRQFAALRIMGASRKQLVTLVLTEATCYSLTALPLGAGLSVIFCKLVMERFHYAGLEDFTFSINPFILALTILLCLIAVFISAYTSAMWAARKLSPLEALQYGKPRKKAKLPKPRKTRIYKRSGSFILGYTIKNIRRTGKRFVISTISMTLGIVLFAFCVLSAASFMKFQKESGNLQKKQPDYSLCVFSPDADELNLAEKLFGNSDCISSFSIDYTGFFDQIEDASHVLGILHPDFKEFPSAIFIQYIPQKKYAQDIEPVLGKSYAEFSAEGKAYVYTSCYSDRYDENQEPIRIREDSFRPLEEYDLPEDTVVFISGYETALGGTLCFDGLYSDAENRVNRADPYISGALLLPLESAEQMPNENYSQAIISITVKNAKSNAACLDLIEEFREKTGYTSSFENRYTDNTGRADFMKAILAVVSAFLLTIWLVGILTMVNSINTSVLNRQGELRMMLAVGMTPKQLMQNVYLESILFSSISTILGTCIGTLGYIKVLQILLLSDSYMQSFQLHPLLIIGIIMLILLLNLIIAVLSALPGIHTLNKSMETPISA